MSADRRDEDPRADEAASADAEDNSGEETSAVADVQQGGILGMTLRELLILCVWVVLFAVSFFPLYSWDTAPSLWQAWGAWILPIGVPTLAVFLLILRRFSPQGIRRVGSLGIDQFASVAFSVGALSWAQTVWSIASTTTPVSWVVIVQLIGSIALVILTVCAPIIPGLAEDFQGRATIPGHRNAAPVRAVVPRPRPERPARPPRPAHAARPAPAPVADIVDDDFFADLEASSSHPVHEPEEAAEGDDNPTVVFGAVTEDSDDAAAQLTDEIDRLDAPDRVPLTAHAAGGSVGTWARPDEEDGTAPGYARGAAPDPQPFWALAPTERDVLDDHGRPLFRIGPDAWALVLEDRGGAYVIRHDDGRIGYLHDISDLRKG